LPVPADPAGEPPKPIESAYVCVMMQRSVSGVMTRRPLSLMYSYPE
jgi:hypothetical protein